MSSIGGSALRVADSSGIQFGSETYTEGIQRNVSASVLHLILRSSALVCEVNPPRDPSRSPLFDVMFVLQTTDTAAGNLPAFFLPGSGAQLATAQSGLQLQAAPPLHRQAPQPTPVRHSEGGRNNVFR